jgi:hypothetical protein
LGGGPPTALHGRLAAAGATWHAPALVQVAVASVLRRLNLAKQLSDLRGRQALQTLSSLPLRLHEHAPLLPRAWVPCARTFLPTMRCASPWPRPYAPPLLTLDAKRAATSCHHARIEPL